MPEERVAAIEARLIKLFENTGTSDKPEFPTEYPKEYRFTGKKPFALKTAAISLSAVAAAVVVTTLTFSAALALAITDVRFFIHVLTC